jgi:hypothetical protein
MAGRKATGNVSVKVRLSGEQVAWLTGDGSRSVQAGLQACVRMAMAGDPLPEIQARPAKPARPAVAVAPAALPPANRGGRWVCDRKDCNRKPVNFGDVCSCCGKQKP